MEAIEYLQALVNQQLCYALKSPDMDLFDFGFGGENKIVEPYTEERINCAYFLHAICRLSIIPHKREHQIKKYYETTPSEIFHTEIKHLIGSKIKRVTLSDKNDLWLDFGDFWIVFATFETGEESWRFFTLDKALPHLVASDCWINLVR